MKRLNAKWCLSWQGVDRSELFAAVRPNEKWRDDVINNGQPMDDHDRDSISASVYVSDLDELRELLNATQAVKSDWGAVLHCLSSGDDRISLSATLATRDAQFTTDCGVSVRPPKDGGSPVYDALLSASRTITDVLQELKHQAI